MNKKFKAILFIALIIVIVFCVKGASPSLSYSNMSARVLLIIAAVLFLGYLLFGKKK